ncbi:MAG: helix-turn-helix domain-containing protein [Carbonactinosporaceae bacterium]
MDEGTIGARLRTLRRWRGMSLTAVADQAGLSTSFLSMVERGQRALDRRSHIGAVAAALRVSEAELVGGPQLSADPVQSRPHAGIPALQVALETNVLGEPLCERPRPLAELVTEMTEWIEPLRRNYDYIGMGEKLPAVIDELHAHVADPADEGAHRLALETLVEAAFYANILAKGLGYLDLAHVAARMATEAATTLGDPVQAGKAAFMRVLAVPKAGSWERALTMAERAVGALQPHATSPLGVQVLGMLALSASLAAASINRGQIASEWLGEAEQLAGRVPDDPESNWSYFSATNVGVWRVTVGVEHGEVGGAVLEKARTVDERKIGGVAGRRASFFADVGRGLARERSTREQAVRWLRRAENAAPQHIRNSPAVRETVAVLLSQSVAAAGGRELRGMASRMRVPH